MSPEKTLRPISQTMAGITISVTSEPNPVTSNLQDVERTPTEHQPEVTYQLRRSSAPSYIRSASMFDLFFKLLFSDSFSDDNLGITYGIALTFYPNPIVLDHLRGMWLGHDPPPPPDTNNFKFFFFFVWISRNVSDKNIDEQTFHFSASP